MEERTTASRYPAPPSYYKLFTTENLEALKEFRAKSKQQLQEQQQPQSTQDAFTQPATTQSTETTQNDATQSQSPKPSSPSQQQQQQEQQQDQQVAQQLPDELKFLVPPKPPTKGEYMSFGDIWHIPERNMSLEQANIPQLFASPGDESHSIDRAQELRRLSKSVLMNYLELVGVLGVNPGQYEAKIQDLRYHFINLHQLINDYRPHQARETLIAMMEEQLETSRRETEQNRAASRKMRELLKSLSTYDAAGLLDTHAMPEDAKKGNQAPDVNMEDGGDVGKASGSGGAAAQSKDAQLWNLLQSMGAGV